MASTITGGMPDRRIQIDPNPVKTATAATISWYGSKAGDIVRRVDTGGTTDVQAGHAQGALGIASMPAAGTGRVELRDARGRVLAQQNYTITV